MSERTFGNRLLVIDDEPGICRPIQKIAERCDFKVFITDNPGTFVSMARSWKPTVIVMDLKMPIMDGITLLRELAAEGCDAQVIISSGADKAAFDAAMRLGKERGLRMSGILLKPFRAENLRTLFSDLAKTPPAELAV